MVIFAFETKETKELLRFVFDTNSRLSEENLVNNPFIGKIHLMPPDTYLVQMEPVYPKFYQFGLIGLLISLAFTRGWSLWLLPSLFLLSTGFLWTRYFYIIFIRLGSKKAGHNNKLRLVTGRETLNRLISRIL